MPLKPSATAAICMAMTAQPAVSLLLKELDDHAFARPRHDSDDERRPARHLGSARHVFRRLAGGDGGFFQKRAQAIEAFVFRENKLERPQRLKVGDAQRSLEDGFKRFAFRSGGFERGAGSLRQKLERVHRLDPFRH